MYKLKPTDNFIYTFENSVKECWDKPAIDDYKVSSITYGQLAAEIEELVLFWKAIGLVKGDKIAINARSSAAWAKIFLASQVGGFVSVQLVNDLHLRILQTLSHTPMPRFSIPKSLYLARWMLRSFRR